MTPRARFPLGRATRPRLEYLESREVPAVIGALDPSFGTAGRVIQSDIPFVGVATEPDGKVVAVGSKNNDFVVVRYNADGSLDTAFGTGGVATVDFALGGGNVDQATDVAVQADGKIVVVGSASTTAAGDDFAVARLNADGSLDGTFGTGGKVHVDFAGGGTADDDANGVAIAADGDIYVVGSAASAGTTKFGVARLSSAGVPVTAFGTGGHEFVTFGGTSEAGQGIAIQPGGKLVVVGVTTTVATGDDFAIARLDPTTGAPDTSFNPGGTTPGEKTVDFGGADDTAFDVAVQADGKIVVAGQSRAAAAEAAAAARLNADGSLDTGFGTAGLKTVDFGGGSGIANRVLIQPDGQIVLVGNNGADIVVARLLGTTGALDTSFTATGLTATVIGSSFDGNGGALTPDGRVVVAGSSNANSDGAVARLIGTVERPPDLSVGGSLDGRAAVYTPDPATGQYGTAAATAAGVFPGFAGLVRSAVGDVNGDGIPDVILVTGPGTPVRFAVLNGADLTTLLVPPTAPFAGSEDFTGGGFVAAADLNNDGRAEIILTPDQGGGPRVTIFSLAAGATAPAVVANFLGIDDPNFRGGARAAVGDVNGDGVADLAVAAGFLGGPRVALFDGKTVLGSNPTRLVNDFFAFPGSDAVNL
ncbi:MAG TPA: FG-GAP-like repeat-containing protein, partial [Urbifossiella sp.]|nr:FG-GAP-like repeat-containing protein [Urbifossiella sp.]